MLKKNANSQNKHPYQNNRTPNHVRKFDNKVRVPNTYTLQYNPKSSDIQKWCPPYGNHVCICEDAASPKAKYARPTRAR